MVSRVRSSDQTDPSESGERRTIMAEQIFTIVEASRELGVAPIVVTTLVRGHRIQTKPVPRNGKARGLTRADLQILRRALGMVGRRGTATAQTAP